MKSPSIIFTACTRVVSARDTMEEYCIRSADMLSSPSQALVHIVNRRLGLDPQRHPCDVIYNPMDFESLPDLPGPGAFSEDEPMTCIVRR